MRRITVVLAAAAALVAGACGGDDEDARALLQRAFDKPIGSAVVTADVEIGIDGIEELSDPIRLQVTGPYRSGGDAPLPVFDWDASFSGGGQTITAGLLSTSENLFVTFGGEAYEVGEDALERAGDGEGQQRSLSDFGIEPLSWLGEASDEGEETIAGVATTHVTAKVDVRRLLDDLDTLAERAGTAVGGPPPQLSDDQKRQVADAVSEPVLDVYVGRDDEIIRRLSASLELEVPESSREDVGGIEGGRITFSVEFADVGRDVAVEAPAGAKPIGELASQLGGLGGLVPGAGGGEQGQDGFSAYSECLERADPSDLEAIQACSELLR